MYWCVYRQVVYYDIKLNSVLNKDHSDYNARNSFTINSMFVTNYKHKYADRTVPLIAGGFKSYHTSSSIGAMLSL